jgi:2-dehydro-3-deoxygluconokinase
MWPMTNLTGARSPDAFSTPETRSVPEQKTRVVCVGEVMIELAREPDGRLGFGCGGDTFNMAIYLARAGIEVAYATALGDDRYSDGILALATAEGVRSEAVLRVPDRLPGLCLIETDATGERQLFYWRERSPARELLELPDWGRVADAMLGAKLVLFSGITLSIYSNNAIGRFLAVVEMARQKGVTIAFDGNFRPRGWSGDIARARAVFMETLKRVDIALPTYDDEALLWGDPRPEATIERMQAFGIAEIAVKNGAHGALVAAGGKRELVPVPEVVVPVDTTAAGDSFNAGYLAARLSGKPPGEAAADAHRLAAQKIRHRGPIMPRAALKVH